MKKLLVIGYWLLVFLFIFLCPIPYTLAPASANHCDDIDPNDPDFDTLCAARVNHQPQYCENNKKFDNLDNGEHAPSSPNCSVGQICATVNPEVNNPNSSGVIVTHCQNPNANPGIIGQECEYQQNINGQIQNCHGKYNLNPAGNTFCGYYPGVDPQCSTAAGAGTVDQIFGRVLAPSFVSGIGFGSAGISTFLGNILRLLYIAGILIFVFMVIFSGVQWIASGGDKESISKARGRLTNAMIGIALLALAGVLITTLGRILGFTFFG